MHRIAVVLGVAFALSGCRSREQSKQKPAEPAKPPAPAMAEAPGKLEPLAADTGQHSGKVLWARSIGGVDTDAIRGVAVHRDGMISIAGYSKTEAQFGEDKPTPLKGSDAFIALMGGDGTLGWVRHFGGDGEDLAEAVAVDREGAALVAGSFSNELVFEDDKLKSRGADDAFIGKFDRNGKRLWLRRLGGRDIDASNSVTVDGAGNVFVTGSFRDSAEIAGTNLKAQGESDLFVVALSPVGEILWVKAFGGSENDYGRTVAVNSAGSVYLLAEFSRSISFDNVKLESAGNRDIALVELRRDGQVAWGKSFGNEYDTLGFGMGIDGAGGIFVTGGFEQTMTIGKTALKSEGRADAFVVKFDSKGEVAWAERYGGKDDDMGLEVRADEFGNAIVSGRFAGEAGFADKKLKSRGDGDAFVAKLSPDGKLLWVQGFGGPERDSGRGLAITARGETILGGAFLKSAQFGDKTLTCPDPEGALLPKANAFLLSLAP